MVRFLKNYTKNLSAPGSASFCNFSLFRLSFLLLLAISKGQFLMRHKKKCCFHGYVTLQRANLNVPQEEMLLNMDNSVILASFWAPPHKLRKMVRFLKNYTKNLSAPGSASFCNFSLFRLSFLLLLAISKGQFLMRHKNKYYFHGYVALQRANLNVPQEELLLSMDHAHKMPPSKEQFVVCHKKKYY